MSEALAHRGSDAAGLWVDGQIGLGHRMRWNTIESQRENLPKSVEQGRFAITADARIDNKEELIEQLGSIFVGGSEEVTDADLILASYTRWGEHCVEKLLGDFVFMIWDSFERRIFCARDSMGVKHFYYYFEPGRLFALASEIKALFTLNEIPRELDEEHIGDILILNFYDKVKTPYRHIQRLPANNALIVDRNGLRIRQYWRPQTPVVSRSRSNRDHEDEFRDIFTKAVTCRMSSTHPVGAMLSGGLDSSSITCVAARFMAENGEGPIPTFSAIFPRIAKIDQRIDERSFIDSVLEHTGCDPTFIEADAHSPLDEMDKMHWHADHPIGVPNVFMDWALFKAAGTRKVRTLLSGFDGDSTVSYGYEALPELVRKGQWVRMIKDSLALRKNMPHSQHTIRKLLWKNGLRPAIPEFALQARRVLLGIPRHLPKPRQMPSAIRFGLQAINPDFEKEIKLEKRYFDQMEAYFPEDIDRLTEDWNGLCSGLFNFALETFEKTAAAFEVEPRFPFFDRRLIEFCLSLPARQKLLGGWTRSILRRAMGGLLPPDVQWRRDKANIGLSFKLNLIKYGRREIESAIFDTSSMLGRFFDTEKLIEAYRRYEADPLRYNGEPMLIMSSVYLSNWLRNSFEGSRA